MSVFGAFLVRIFPHSDWIRRVVYEESYSARMRENTDQKNSEYGHFLRSGIFIRIEGLFIMLMEGSDWFKRKTFLNRFSADLFEEGESYEFPISFWDLKMVWAWNFSPLTYNLLKMRIYNVIFMFTYLRYLLQTKNTFLITS